MAPPLDRKDLYTREWKSRSTTFRLPRRTRRATYICWALVIATFYFLLNSATTWQVPTYFEAKQPLIPIRFPNLYPSLSQVIGSSGKRKWNRNVIFLAANLTAASKLAGMACEMADYRRVNVHLAFMGFDTLDLGEFRRINGLPVEDATEGCMISLHDARPESAELLPLERKKIAAKSAFRHINKFMHPQAVFMDPANEEEWFLDIAREKAKQLEEVLIELPKHAVDDLNWISRLDAGSLSAWHKPSFEIVIHADTHSGNLERLLRSIQHAYYPSLDHRPKLITIILNPHTPIHTFAKDFLRNYKFPDQHKVVIRHPLVPQNDAHATTVNFVESFFTLSGHHSVLFLDPNTELSKWYSHYLLFATLNYRYSSYQNLDTDTLFGISLEPPASYLDGKIPFSIDGLDSTPFLYPSPASRAALIFPQHWSEFHSYVSHKLSPHLRAKSRNATNEIPELRLADEYTNSWQSHFIELVRARGYTMLYPSFKETLAIVHSEIPSRTTRKATPEQKIMEGKFLELLPSGGDFPDWSKLPMKDLWGKPVGASVASTAAMRYRLAITTCKETKYGRDFKVDDLFCDEDGNSV